MAVKAILIDWPLNVCSRAHRKINTTPNLASEFIDRKVLRKWNKYLSPHTNGKRYFAPGGVWKSESEINKFVRIKKLHPPLEIKGWLLYRVYLWYKIIIVNNKVKIYTLTELRHHGHFRSPTMTYLRHQVPIQSQQIYFLQTFIIFAFFTIFSHFREKYWYNDENFNLKTFVFVTNALWTEDIWNCEKYDWIRAPYVIANTTANNYTIYKLSVLRVTLSYLHLISK